MKRVPLRKVSVKQTKEIALRRKVRQELMEQANGACQNCHQLPDWRGLQMHHRVSLSRGGKTDTDNCQMWCARCHFGPEGHNHHEVITDPQWTDGGV